MSRQEIAEIIALGLLVAACGRLEIGSYADAAGGTPGTSLAGPAGAGSGGSASCPPGAIGVDGAALAVRAVFTSSSSLHACALTITGALKCWGDNTVGQLGLGHTNNMGDEPGEMGDDLPFVELGERVKVSPQSVGVGGWRTCVILESGKIKCWGDNYAGRLGLGDTEARGDQPGEMGTALREVDLGGDYKAVAIALTYTQSCAVLDTGQVKCWGTKYWGLLPDAQFEEIGDQPGEMGDALPFLELGAVVPVADPLPGGKVIAAGGDHMCARLEGGQEKCWGINGYGQLGRSDGLLSDEIPPQAPDGIPAGVSDVGIGREHSCAVVEGKVMCWGNNEAGQLGLGHTDQVGDDPGEMSSSPPYVQLTDDPSLGALAVSGGWRHTCALLGDTACPASPSELKCWGDNAFGTLGLEDTQTRGDQAGEMGDALPIVNLGARVLQISAGFGLTCVVLETSRVKCWGTDGRYLGLGSPDPRGAEPGDMARLPPVDLGSKLPY